MLGNVYMKSNEISFKVKAPQNAPALESREKNGKSSNRGSRRSQILATKIITSNAVPDNMIKKMEEIDSQNYMEK